MSIPKRLLGNTGLSVSILGFGASPLGSVFSEINEDEGVESVHEAIRQGINFIDVSPFYGGTRAEKVLGRALKDIPREKFILSTKVGRYGDNKFDFSAKRVTESVEESLARLNVDFIDIIQCHDIEFVNLDQIVSETIPALISLKNAGKVRFIGITGLPLKIFSIVLDRLPPNTVDVILSYCHYSLNDSSLSTILPYLKKKQVGVISASPLSMGLLTPQGPPAWHPAPPMVKIACKSAADHCAFHQHSITKLALQFSVLNPDISATLVGMCTPQQVKENVEAVKEAISGQFSSQMIDELQVILGPIKDTTWESGLLENN